MKFLKNNICTVLALALVLTVSMAGDASAASSVFSTAMNKLSKLFKDTKNVLFIIGGFGLVALAFQAIFGKLKWAWFAALALGLAVVAAAGKVVDYATDSNVASGRTSDSLN